ncbi:hypothetical protein [Streptomyces coeruleorubidus]|jgi:hypothetical protein|uniref:hypothetical protein n=1 Tax=Streptomyces coeruleorubidus TaxID=116188 RepID=UPI0033BA58A6
MASAAEAVKVMDVVLDSVSSAWCRSASSPRVTRVAVHSHYADAPGERGRAVLDFLER